MKILNYLFKDFYGYQYNLIEFKLINYDRYLEYHDKCRKNTNNLRKIIRQSKKLDELYKTDVINHANDVINRYNIYLQLENLKKSYDKEYKEILKK